MLGNPCDEDCPEWDQIGIVNLHEYAVLVQHWLSEGDDLEADLDRDGQVNLADLLILAAYWLGDCSA
ncbi:MAG: hypothetical protein JW810_04045 [Sedimentisphaerales bacterium]|nr:hypothetical protein [Sedimentisphaerales bacterium]